MLMWRSGCWDRPYGVVSHRADRRRRRGQVASTVRRRRAALPEAAGRAYPAGARRGSRGWRVARRLPERAFVSLLHRDGERPDSVAFSRVSGGAAAQRPRPLLRDRRPVRARHSSRSTIASRSARSPCPTSWPGSCCSSSSTAATRSSPASPITTDERTATRRRAASAAEPSSRHPRTARAAEVRAPAGDPARGAGRR